MTSETPFFERLSAMDAAFLAAETGGVHMHIAGLMRFDRCELCRSDGGVDFGFLRARAVDLIESETRLRQRLAWSPGLKHPYWVDDPHFRLSYHVRHTSLPRPGSDRQLLRLMGRILSQRLDREKPLWEMWVVEGLGDGGFAVIMKLHHCVVDGVGAMRLLARSVADVRGPATVPPARPAPSPRQLLEAEAKHRGRFIAELGAGAAEAGVDFSELADAFTGVKSFSETVWHRAPRTRLNPEHLTGHRRFETLSVSFEDIRRVKREHGVKVNDVVLAIVTEALRRYLGRGGVDLASLKPFRAMVPANTRSGPTPDKLGNELGLMMTELPMDEPDPIEQLRAIHRTTEYLKHESHEVDSTRWLSQMDTRIGLGLMGSAFKWGSKLRPFNVTVTNVPGPPMRVKSLGAPLRALYGAVPLTEQQGLGITLFSYAGELHFGLHADQDALDDLHLLVDDLRAAFDGLCGSG